MNRLHAHAAILITSLSLAGATHVYGNLRPFVEVGAAIGFPDSASLFPSITVGPEEWTSSRFSWGLDLGARRLYSSENKVSTINLTALGAWTPRPSRAKVQPFVEFGGGYDLWFLDTPGVQGEFNVSFFDPSGEALAVTAGVGVNVLSEGRPVGAPDLDLRGCMGVRGAIVPFALQVESPRAAPPHSPARATVGGRVDGIGIGSLCSRAHHPPSVPRILLRHPRARERGGESL